MKKPKPTTAWFPVDCDGDIYPCASPYRERIPKHFWRGGNLMQTKPIRCTITPIKRKAKKP